MSEVSAAQKKISILDESLPNTSPSDCHLQMQVVGNHFSYALIDLERNKYIALCDYRLPEPLQQEDISSLFSLDELPFDKSSLKKSIAVYSSRSALMPASLYKKEDAAALLALTVPLQDDDVPCADHLKYADTVHLYALKKSLINAINNSFSTITVIHTGTILIESELLRNKNNAEHSMLVNVHEHAFDIVLTRGGSLLYYNSFTYINSEDFIYFILFVMEQLKLNPENTPLRLTGDIEKTSATYLITNKYVRNIFFGEKPDAYEYSYGLRVMSPHACYSLLNQYLCVS